MSSRPPKSIQSNAQAVPQLVDVLEPHVECCICMGTLYNAASCTPCLHTFCIGCIVQWTEKNHGKCPLCRVSVKEISPNWVMRDLVKSYLLVKPGQQRSEKDKEDLDQSELAYIVKWLGETDKKLLYIESLASLRSAPETGDQKYAAMMARAIELFKKFLSTEKNPIPMEDLKRGLNELIEEVNKEIFPATIFVKYHRLERAYKNMVRLSVPKIGPAEHTWLGNYYFDTAYGEVLEDSFDDMYDGSDDEFNLNVSHRIGTTLFELRHPEQRRPPRATVGGFDPVDLEALARVQNMRAPGFIRRNRPGEITPESQSSSPRMMLPPEVRRPSNRHRIQNMEPIPEQISSRPMQTRRYSRTTEGSNSLETDNSSHLRRSARLAARTQET